MSKSITEDKTIWLEYEVIKKLNSEKHQAIRPITKRDTRTCSQNYEREFFLTLQRLYYWKYFKIKGGIQNNFKQSKHALQKLEERQ